MILDKIHVHRTIVDFDLLDAGNVVYHPNYLVLCERARSAALAAAGYSFQEMWNQGMALAVLECNSKYFRAIELAHDLAILTRATNSTGTRISVQQDIVLASTLDPVFRETGFKSAPIDPPKKDLFFHADFLLGCVTLHPIKGARPPEALVKALALQNGFKQQQREQR